MSIHKSLVPASKLRRHRNVLRRSERIELLEKEGRWSEDRSVFGLAKVRNILMKAKKTKKEEAAAPAEGAAAVAAVPGAAAPAGKGAAPAAAKGAAPAKGAAAPAAAAKGAAAPAKKEEKKK